MICICNQRNCLLYVHFPLIISNVHNILSINIIRDSTKKKKLSLLWFFPVCLSSENNFTELLPNLREFILSKNSFIWNDQVSTESAYSLPKVSTSRVKSSFFPQQKEYHILVRNFSLLECDLYRIIWTRMASRPVSYNMLYQRKKHMFV